MRKSLWLLLLAACMTAAAANPSRADGFSADENFLTTDTESDNAHLPKAAPPAGLAFVRPDDLYESLYDDARFITPAFKRVERLYKSGKIREAYAEWLQLAWQGDMFAMASLSVVSRVHADQTWPVPPEFWEGWLLTLLGKGEGGYVLGVQYAMLADQYEAGSRSRDFFLQSALTGHWAGMYGTFATAGEREDIPFSPPATPPVTPIQARFMEDRNGEARYWLTRAADSGYWKAAGLLATYYANPQKGAADYARAEHYAAISAENGSVENALTLGAGYADGTFKQHPQCEGYYNYMLLADRLRYNSEPSIERLGRLIRHIKSNPECQKSDAVASGLAESKQLYESWKARSSERQQHRNKLYTRARARLPEVGAAHEKALLKSAPAS